MKVFAPVIACASLLATSVHAEADLRGVWQIKGDHADLRSLAIDRVDFTTEGQSRYDRNHAAVAKRDVAVDRVQRCSSPGMPRILLLPYPFEILQEKGYIAFTFEWNQLFRQIPLKGERDQYTLPSPMGFSKGEWQGDVLVVTTTDRDDTTLLDNSGLPHGAMLKLTERLSLKQQGKVLEDRIQIDDAEFYRKPWTAVLEFERQKNVALKEDTCLDRVNAGRAPIETPAERRKTERKH